MNNINGLDFKISSKVNHFILLLFRGSLFYYFLLSLLFCLLPFGCVLRTGEIVHDISAELAGFSAAGEGLVPYAYDDGDGRRKRVRVKGHTDWTPIDAVKRVLTIGYGINLMEASRDSSFRNYIIDRTIYTKEGYLVLTYLGSEDVSDYRQATAAQRKHAEDLYKYWTEKKSPVSTLNDVLRNNDIKLNQHEYDAMRDVQYNSPRLAGEVIGKIREEGRTAAMRHLGNAVGTNDVHKRGLWVRRYNEIRLFLKGVYEYNSLKTNIIDPNDDEQRSKFNKNFNDEDIKVLMISYWDLF